MSVCEPCIPGKYCPEANMTEVGPECDIGCYCTGFRLFINIFDSFGFYLFKDETVLNPTGKILDQRDRSFRHLMYISIHSA